jgi:protein TonB
MGIVIVVAIHVLAVAGLVTALATGAILKQMAEIKASVERVKTPPKPPPPPPVDMKAPPPVSAIIPQFNVTTEAPPPPVTVKAPPPPAPTRAAAPPPPPPTELHAITRSHSLPPYPTISQRLGEQGTTTMIVDINTEGTVTDCKIEHSSSSQRLDSAACDYVKSHWRWQPPTQLGKPVAATTRVSVVWNLKNAQ